MRSKATLLTRIDELYESKLERDLLDKKRLVIRHLSPRVDIKHGRGRPSGTSQIDLHGEPVTPFAALRLILRISQSEWAELLNISRTYLSFLEKGRYGVSVPVAKRMQEEARRMGVAVTLDEMYQNVVPWVGSSHAKRSEAAAEPSLPSSKPLDVDS